jgi:outer membrane biosynthesis protein TonB
MCFGGGGSKVSTPAPPPVPAPPAPPPPPPTPTPAPKPVQAERSEVAVRPKTTARQRMGIRQGTSQLRIPLNIGGSGKSGGLNV